MRKLALLLLALSCLTGCRQTSQVENQAFAVIMSMDASSDGGIELSIILPKMNSKDESYITASASGRSFSDAVENLRELFPRSINLSHTKLIVASKELAETDAFSSILRDIEANYPLCTAARFVISRDSAEEFIASQDTTVGSRLSISITAMFDHYTSTGEVPDVTLADLIYLTDSCYSSPIAIYGEHGALPATAGAEKSDFDFSDANLYCGTAVFRDGKLALVLNADETALMELLRGRRSAFVYSTGDVFAKIRNVKPIDVRIEGDTISITAEIGATLYNCSRGMLEEKLEADIQRLISKCQAAGCEPFQLAERAAGIYPDLASWQSMDWMERFSEMEIKIKVKISPQTT